MWWLALQACLAQDAPPPSGLASAPPALAEVADNSTVGTAFPPPSGARRIPGDAFGSSLRSLRLEPVGTPVLTYDGRVVRRDARVIALPLAEGDLQQCADSVIRVRAEWQREQGLPVSFHATSGDPLPWARWQAGERPREVSGRLQWSGGQGPGTWEGYLRAVFMWSGSWSLQRFDSVPAADPVPGDVLVSGGFPGHAVLILDVAEREGERWVLIGQGFMPAQSFYVDPGPVGGWWPWVDPLALSVWTFSTSELRRWPSDAAPPAAL
ncbi:MAG: hypothetical protein JXX28_07370 [Deltaproteobacteria bacterium]|nr:hypothetical protein [Deltaproteobacteria bacterium]